MAHAPFFRLTKLKMPLLKRFCRLAVLRRKRWWRLCLVGSIFPMAWVWKRFKTKWKWHWWRSSIMRWLSRLCSTAKVTPKIVKHAINSNFSSIIARLPTLLQVVNLMRMRTWKRKILPRWLANCPNPILFASIVACWPTDSKICTAKNCPTNTWVCWINTWFIKTTKPVWPTIAPALPCIRGWLVARCPLVVTPRHRPI